MITNYLALDVGRARIGLATANSLVRIAAALPAISNDEVVISTLQDVITENEITEIVLGWPRGLQGQETDQTKYVADFMVMVQKAIQLPMHTQDEALTSVKAEAELQQRGKPYDKGAIDSLSAVYILEDYLAEGVH